MSNKRPPPPPVRIGEPAPAVPAAAPPARTSAPSPPPATPKPQTAEWHYAQNNVQKGPITFSQLKDLASSGRLRPTDLVWKVGMPNWIAARTVQGLFSIRTPSLTTPPQTAIKPSQASGMGTIVISRKPKLTAFLYAAQIMVDSNYVGEIAGGVAPLFTGERKQLSFSLPAGNHTIDLAGGGLRRSTTIVVAANQTSRFLIYFSNLGALGGGLKIENEGTAADSAQTGAQPPRRVAWKPMLLGSMALMVLFCGGVRGCLQAGGSGNKVATSAAKPGGQTVVQPESHPKVNLANGRVPIEQVIDHITFWDDVKMLHAESNQGDDVEGTPFANINNVVGERCRLLMGSRERRGTTVQVFLVEVASSHQLAAMILTTEIQLGADDNHSKTSGLIGIGHSVLPDFNIREMIGRHQLKLTTGQDATEKTGKAGITLSFTPQRMMLTVLLQK